jgi:hypothetical protein
MTSKPAADSPGTIYVETLEEIARRLTSIHASLCERPNADRDVSAS